MNVIALGYGFYGVDIGTLGDTPAVFIIPNEDAGPVGEKMPMEKQGPLALDHLPDNWLVLTLPTRDRCKEVADALVGSKMERWTADDNVFRYLSNDVASVPADAIGQISLRTASEIERDRLLAKGYVQ